MSRVEENVKIRKDISDVMEYAMEVAEKLFGNERATLLNSAKMTAANSYLEDISRSLAVIADDIHYFREKDEAKGWSLGIHGTEQICGFCDKAEYTTMDIDEAIYHCSENDTDVAFTCPGCDKFIDVRHKKQCEKWANGLASTSILPPGEMSKFVKEPEE